MKSSLAFLAVYKASNSYDRYVFAFPFLDHLNYSHFWRLYICKKSRADLSIHLSVIINSSSSQRLEVQLTLLFFTILCYTRFKVLDELNMSTKIWNYKNGMFFCFQEHFTFIISFAILLGADESATGIF